MSELKSGYFEDEGDEIKPFRGKRLFRFCQDLIRCCLNIKSTSNACRFDSLDSQRVGKYLYILLHLAEKIDDNIKCIFFLLFASISLVVH
jgi:hypothetical protein